MAKFSTDDFFIFGDGVEYSGDEMLALVFWRVPCFQRGPLSEVKRLKRYVEYQ